MSQDQNSVHEKLEGLGLALLWLMYSDFISDRAFYKGLNDLSSSFPAYPKNVIRLCLANIRDQGFIEVVKLTNSLLPGLGTTTEYRITARGLAEAEGWTSDDLTWIRGFIGDSRGTESALRIDRLDNADKSTSENASPAITGHEPEIELSHQIELVSYAPASDRVVTLEHNSATYRDTIDALEELSREARSSNEFGQLFTDPEDRIRTLSEIDHGIDLLKRVRIKISAIRELLVSNLQIMVEKLSDASLSALASKALDGLLELFKGS